MGGDQRPELQDALRFASDTDRLLDGENPATTYLDDAVIWEETYRELAGYKQSLVERSRAAEKAISPTGAHEIRADLVILEAELGRLQRRLGFWQHRRTELANTSSGPGAIPPSRERDSSLD